MSGYAQERAGNAPDTIERRSSMLEATNEVRGMVNETMLRLRTFNHKNFGPLPPQPQEPKNPNGGVGPGNEKANMQTQFYQSIRVIKDDLDEINAYISNMENLI